MFTVKPDVFVNCFDYEDYLRVISEWGFTEQDYVVEFAWDEHTLMPWASICFTNDKLKLLWELKHDKTLSSSRTCRRC